ncbi:hypothetical protein ACNJYD_02810 [Bradyrhizobium sp. DASA03005]|uniref:hypothetical protein n=1 Tax=Bradyrhizobium sp. SPXBL-02 TaxID=3395912 RepID=UPI003F703DDD
MPLSGGKEMRRLSFAMLCVALGGCYATGADVRAKLGQDYVGQNVDAHAVRWGPPASSFKMNSGDTAYSWQLASGSSFSVSRDGQSSASGSSRAYACKVNVVAAPNGTIKSLDTEDKDKSLYYGPIPTGVQLGSVCAEQLGMKQQ